MRLNLKLFSFLILSCCCYSCQKTSKNKEVSSIDTLSIETQKATLIFAGDAMQHLPQVHAAYNAKDNSYSYDSCFILVKERIEKADLAIVNLETTFGGKPYSGYPMFSSPNEFGNALKNTGFDVLVTANNHCCDRGNQGIIKTINYIDSLQLKTTGTFKNFQDKKQRNPLILEVNQIKIALIAYTYGTNGISFKDPIMVNILHRDSITKDINKAKEQNCDFIIAIPHWGNEYILHPTKEQKEWMSFFKDVGVDIVIGSHPHVVQPIFFEKDSIGNQFLGYYSLGNFISNQRKTPCDGGILAQFTLNKKGNLKWISSPYYQIFWVDIKTNSLGRKSYQLIPIEKQDQQSKIDTSYTPKQQIFIKTIRNLFEKNNSGDISEL